MTPRYTCQASRRGITLIELLIVIFIMLLITAISIPAMTPSLEQRRLRETSRLVTSFIQGARTRAIQTGRPVGVWIEPLAGTPTASITMFYAESPPLYAGDAVASTITTNGAGRITAMPSSSGWTGLIKPGDLIRFGYTGPMYRIFNGEPFHDLDGDGVWDSGEPFADIVTANNNYNGPFVPVDSNGCFTSLSITNYWCYCHADRLMDNLAGAEFTVISPTVAQFQIHRQPVKMAGAPLTLPEGRAIDLSASGASGPATLPAGAAGPFIIEFSPGGAVTRLSYAAGSIEVTGPIYLLIGSIERVGSARNYEATPSHAPVWVTIQPQTGLITASEAGPGGETFNDTNGNGDWDTGETFTDSPPTNGTRDGPTVAQSRYYAQQGQGLGGR